MQRPVGTTPQAAHVFSNILVGRGTYDRAVNYQMIEIACKALNRRVSKVYIPSMPVVAVLRFLEKLAIRLPIKSEQILRLNENKNFDYTEATKDFNFTPIHFAAGIRLELSEMGITVRK